MKLTNFMAFAVFCGISLFSTREAEARVHFGINIGGPTVVRERVYVPEAYERVYVPCYPCYDRVYVAPRPLCREVRVVPGPGYYREYPRPGVSFGYWRY
ncbi:MAG: hypothetical protein ACSNEK_01320 [Parachlamydiaceae bacterium]